MAKDINLPDSNFKYLAIFTATSAIGGFLFGYDTGVIGGANIYIYDDLGHDNATVKETVVSIALLGAFIGALISSWLSDKYGRKKTIIIADIVFIVGSIIMACSIDVLMLIFGRFVIGLGVGIASMIVPIYLSEASPV